MSAQLRRARREGGLTLVELVVTMSITVIMAPILMLVCLGLWKSSQKTTNTSADAGSAKVASDALAYQIRSGAYSTVTGVGAYPVDQASTQMIGFWTGFAANGDVLTASSGRCVQFMIDSTAKTLSQRTFTVGAATSSGGGWKVVASNIIGTSGSSTYSSFATTAAADTTTGVISAASDSNLVRSVGVTLRTKKGSGGSAGLMTGMDSLITMRNSTSVDTTACGNFS